MHPTRRPSCRMARSMDSPSPSTQKRRLFSRSALGMTGVHESTSICTSVPPNDLLEVGCLGSRCTPSDLPAPTPRCGGILPDVLSGEPPEQGHCSRHAREWAAADVTLVPKGTQADGNGVEPHREKPPPANAEDQRPADRRVRRIAMLAALPL